MSSKLPNQVVDLAPFGRWTLRDNAAQRRSPLRCAETQIGQERLVGMPMPWVCRRMTAQRDNEQFGLCNWENGMKLNSVLTPITPITLDV